MSATQMALILNQITPPEVLQDSMERNRKPASFRIMRLLKGPEKESCS